jgi:single-strand DNA-binding protein
MANDLNLCVFIGRLGDDPISRHTKSGKEAVNFRIAVGKSWIDKLSQEKIEVTEWVPVVVWGDLAEICRKYLKKGSLVQITGEFKTRKYTKDGQDRYSTEIVADRMQMLGGKSAPSEKEVTARPTGPAGRQGAFDDFQDDIPF